MNEPSGDDDGPDLFDLFQGRTPLVAALWREHEHFLRSEAARLQIEPAAYELHGRPAFYGEVCAAEERQ